MESVDRGLSYWDIDVRQKIINWFTSIMLVVLCNSYLRVMSACVGIFAGCWDCIYVSVSGMDRRRDRAPRLPKSCQLSSDHLICLMF